MSLIICILLLLLLLLLLSQIHSSIHQSKYFLSSTYYVPCTMPSTRNTVTKKANKICSPGTHNLEGNTDIWSTLSPPTQ